MKRQFYSHLVTFEQIRIEMSGLDLTEKEQKELLEIAGKQLHYVMLNEALSRIHGEDKKQFLQHLSNEKHEEAWLVLRTHAKDVEKHLLHAAHNLYEELREDIRELKRQKPE
ncbi:MAG TPA: hypothetical protein VMR41_02055 [Patescibacteria group bacterium]|nr:hypothetical protein [Patescibacteria group bacterium]